MKKLLSFVLAVALVLSVFSLAGCGGGAGDDDGGYEGVSFDKKAGEMYVDTKAGKTAIKVNYATGYKDEWIRQAARSFLVDENFDYGSKYYFVLTGDAEITTGVSSKLESGVRLSDIYMPLASNWYSYVAAGYVESLDDLYDMQIPGEEGKVSDKITGAWQTYGKATRQSEDHYYVFPWNENVAGIVYNKTMFDKHGWQVPGTVTELIALCEQMVADGEVPFVYPGTVGGGYWDFVGTNWWLQYSGVEKMNEFMKFESPDVFDPDNEEHASYGKKQMLRTFSKVVVDKRATYTLKSSASKNHLLSQVSFAAGEAAMIPNGSWIESESGDVIEDEIRMMAVPLVDTPAVTDDDGNPVRYNYGGQPDYILIPAEADNKTGAKEFLAYMCRDDMLKQYTTYTGAPRPFDYDVSDCEVSDFVRSCLDVWSNSTTWFEASTNPLWTANKVRKFNAANPYTTLLSDATVSATSWCTSEYNGVKGAWAGWLEAI